MSILSGGSDFFGLDISTSAIRLVQLRGSSGNKALARYAYVPVDAKLSRSDSRGDKDKLSTVIRDLVEKSGVLTRNVAASLPSQRVFTTVVDIERLSPGELAKSIRYQADSLIPTALADSKLEWATLGDSPLDKTKLEVLVSSVVNEYLEQRLDMLESIGLNVIAFESESTALARAVTSSDSPGAQMILSMSDLATDLVIVLGGMPRLIRSIPTGYETIVRAASQNLNIDEAQARQFVVKFGMSQEKLEGQVHHAIISTVDILTTEIEKSIKFFHTRYANQKLERVIMTGGASTLPDFPVYMANKLGLDVEIGNAWHNVAFAAEKQNELLAISHQFGVAVGLAQREE